MSERDGTPMDEVIDLLGAAAGRREPPAIGAERAREMARHAWLAAAGRRAQAARRRTLAAGLAVAAAVTLAFVVGRSTLDVEGPDDGPTAVLGLASGDRLTSAPGARVALVRDTPEDRVVRLTQGEVLFDVASTGGAFTVRTPHARVEVRGTVFAVRVDGERTRVHVFEGRVEVFHGDEAAVLGAGDGFGGRWTPVLAAAGRAARDRRLVEPSEGGRIAALSAAEPGIEAESESESARGPESASGPEPATGSNSESATRSRSPTGSDSASAPATESGARSASRTGSASGGSASGSRARSAIVPPAGALDLAAARRALAAGDVDAALEAVARSDRRGAWALLEGDALRAARRFDEAADAYDHAAATSSPSAATHAGYLAARVRHRQLDDAAGALRSLDGSRAAAPHSPVEEAALALRIRVLLALDRRGEARGEAFRHRTRFPSSAHADWIGAVADAD